MGRGLWGLLWARATLAMRRKRFFWMPDLKLGGMLYELWYPLLREYWYDRLKER